MPSRCEGTGEVREDLVSAAAISVPIGRVEGSAASRAWARPKRVNAAGHRELVNNSGLAAVSYSLRIAFALSSCFVLRHSKLVRRDHLTTSAVAAQLHAWISKAPPFEPLTESRRVHPRICAYLSARGRASGCGHSSPPARSTRLSAARGPCSTVFLNRSLRTSTRSPTHHAENPSACRPSPAVRSSWT